MKILELLIDIIPEMDNGYSKGIVSNLDKIKNSFPKPLRSLIFGKWNPVYVYFIFLGNKKKHEGSILLKHNIFSRDFINYIVTHRDNEFDFSEFYLSKDMDAINRFVKYRLLCGINTNGYQVSKRSYLNQQEYEKENVFAQLKKSVTKDKEGFVLKYNNVSYRLPINRIDPYIYSERYGLLSIPDKNIETLKGKIFVDIGAFIGDTAIMLKDYSPSKIVCYEPDKDNLINLKKTIVLNQLDELVEIRTTALSEKPGQMSFIQDNASSRIVENNTLGSDSIEVSTLDIDFKGSSNIGLIKMDVEGFERFVIKGGEKLIKKNKPIILISLYHTGADFFEIPPLLRSYSPDVKFRFIDINPFCPNLGEKILIAYF